VVRINPVRVSSSHILLLIIILKLKLESLSAIARSTICRCDVVGNDVLFACYTFSLITVLQNSYFVIFLVRQPLLRYFGRVYPALKLNLRS
jgi:hypothetical protein